MKPILDDLETWLQKGQTVALAKMVYSEGSSPRETGAVMAVNETGEVIGSISGGCVEAAVVEESLEVMSEGQSKLLTYGIADELGFEVGLTCGGTIQVFVERLSSTDSQSLPLSTLLPSIRGASQDPVVLCTVIEGEPLGKKLLIKHHGPEGNLGNELLEQRVIQDAQGLLGLEGTAIRHYGLQGERCEQEVRVFFESFAGEPKMIIFGAVDFSRSLCQMAKLIGYYVIICDARSALATPNRFPEADAIIVHAPGQYLQNTEVDERTVIVILTHDPKFDVPILSAAVKTQARYIGAMGSRQTTQDRRKRLQSAGLTLAEIDRIHAPIGLDIGASTPQETAVSIMAEIIAHHHGRSGESLSANQNPIHPRTVNLFESSEVGSRW
ncbi:MAG: XdhC family protein [Crocosphaera sp.]|nr:XdhC family protein [Crocosphaera sp.]